jgi:hypothetical protein
MAPAARAISAVASIELSSTTMTSPVAGSLKAYWITEAMAFS